MQVHTDFEGMLNKQLHLAQYTLGSKVASGLSNIYLPPLPPPVDPYVPNRRRRELTPSPIKGTTATASQDSTVQAKLEEKNKARTSLK